jgi:hypothetical protein
MRCWHRRRFGADAIPRVMVAGIADFELIVIADRSIAES